MNQKGFSLLEFVIIVFIMGVASSIIVVRYSENRNLKSLSLGAKQIANDIRMTQNYTFSALETEGINPSGGYGIRFSTDSNSYVIFADDSVAPASPNQSYDVGEEFQTINLPNNVKVQSLKIDGSNVDPLPVDIVFASPYGEVYINGNNKDAGNFIDFEIEISNPAGIEVININSSRKIN